MTGHCPGCYHAPHRRMQIESALIDEVRKGRTYFSISDIAEIVHILRGAVREDISLLMTQSEKLTIRLWTAGTDYIWKISEKRIGKDH